MNPTRIAVWVGYVGLLGLWLAWATVFAPARHAPVAWVLGFSLLPLLAALPGLWRDSRGSFLWLGLISLVYFIHGVGAATDALERIQAALEVAFSLSLFAGSVFRLRHRE